MAFYISVTNDELDAFQEVELEGTLYRFRYSYNDLSGCWYLFVSPSGENAWKLKIKMTGGVDLLKPFRAYDFTPQGSLHVVDTGRLFGRVGQENFDGTTTRFRLLYQTEEERTA